MSAPRDAVVLAAGLGTRFGTDDDVKQLAQFGALSLIERNAQILAELGLARLIAVTGYRRQLVDARLESRLAQYDFDLTCIHNPEYQKANGISAMLGGEAASGAFLLLMADHLFDPEVLEDAMTRPACDDGGILYVDSKLDAIYDIDDATKVQRGTDGRILAIGKDLETFDAVDTGLFIMTPDLPRALRKIYGERGDCSLSDGVQALSDANTMRTRDIGAARWQDVDTLEALEHGEALFGVGSRGA